MRTAAAAADTGDATARPAGAITAAPRLRGLLHAGACPAAVVAGIVLIALARAPQARLAAAVYSVTCITLFGVSAAYHRSPQGSRRRCLLARLDHVSILLVIAGTYTPLTVLALHGRIRLSVLALIWTGTAAGALTRLIWRADWRPAPGWLITSLFATLGWTVVFILPQLLRGAGVLVLVLVLAGGIMYCLGGVVHTLKRPNPSPQWFGFHEIFHAMTIVAYLTQYAAVSLVVYRAA
jgi:hemolysin III